MLRAKSVNVLMRAWTSQACCPLDRIIRADQAGKIGALNVSAGQLAVLGQSELSPLLEHIQRQQCEHKATCDDLVNAYRVRPSLCLPLWQVSGFVLGAASALFGPRAALTCTAAMEAKLAEHYESQLRTLLACGDHPPEVADAIMRFRDDEWKLRELGMKEVQGSGSAYAAFATVVGFATQVAINVSECV